jgi:hypothetical protein
MSSGRDEFPDEFGPYLDEALTNPEFRHHYERARVRAVRASYRRWRQLGWKYLRSRTALRAEIVRQETAWSGKSLPEDELAEAVGDWKGRVPW